MKGDLCDATTKPRRSSLQRDQRRRSTPSVRSRVGGHRRRWHGSQSPAPFVDVMSFTNEGLHRRRHARQPVAGFNTRRRSEASPSPPTDEDDASSASICALRPADRHRRLVFSIDSRFINTDFTLRSATAAFQHCGDVKLPAHDEEDFSAPARRRGLRGASVQASCDRRRLPQMSRRHARVSWSATGQRLAGVCAVEVLGRRHHNFSLRGQQHMPSARTRPRARPAVLVRTAPSTAAIRVRRDRDSPAPQACS